MEVGANSWLGAYSNKYGIQNFAEVDKRPGCKESQFYSLPFGQAVASMY